MVKATAARWTLPSRIAQAADRTRLPGRAEPLRLIGKLCA